jgi:signal peptidase II
VISFPSSPLKKQLCLSRSKLIVLLGFVVFFLDIVTKYLTQKYLPLSYLNSYVYPYGGIAVFKDFMGIEFSINHTINRGAAWGILAEFQSSLLILRIFLVAALFFYLVFYNKDEFKQIPLLLIMVGAVGNVCDYFFYGHVIDMFHFIFWGYDYPVFNVADSAIFIGIVSLFLQSFQKSPTQQSL